MSVDWQLTTSLKTLYWHKIATNHNH